jgi:hypothetical protein
MPQLNDGSIVPNQVNAPVSQMPDGVQAKALAFAWRCENGHILGVVFREKTGHAGTIPRLMLFRGALEPEEPANHAVPFAKVDSAEVVCGICGERKTWAPGDDFVEMLKNGGKK